MRVRGQSGAPQTESISHYATTEEMPETMFDDRLTAEGRFLLDSPVRSEYNGTLPRIAVIPLPIRSNQGAADESTRQVRRRAFSNRSWGNGQRG